MREMLHFSCSLLLLKVLLNEVLLAFCPSNKERQPFESTPPILFPTAQNAQCERSTHFIKLDPIVMNVVQRELHKVKISKTVTNVCY